jgi:23S rRNA (uridine2552-2'-O)-methyltransferase
MSKPYDPKDRFYQQAKAQGLRARSAFKIEEIAARQNLLRAGMSVLDLGAAPGGFLQVLAREVGPKGMVVGVDLVPIKSLSLPQVKTLVADVTSAEFPTQLAAIATTSFDLVTSDMAPKTTGIRTTDEARSLELCRMALECARKYTKPGGSFLTKVFMGGDFKQFENEVRAHFQSVKVMRPEATRERSFEVYVVGKNFRAQSATSTPSAS